MSDQFLDCGRLASPDLVEAIECLEDLDVAHDREEVWQRGHAGNVVWTVRDGCVGELAPVVAILQHDATRPIGIRLGPLHLEQRGVDDRHLEQPRRRTIAEDIVGIEGLAPVGNHLVVVIPGPVGSRARVLQVHQPRNELLRGGAGDRDQRRKTNETRTDSSLLAHGVNSLHQRLRTKSIECSPLPTGATRQRRPGPSSRGTPGSRAVRVA